MNVHHHHASTPPVGCSVALSAQWPLDRRPRQRSPALSWLSALCLTACLLGVVGKARAEMLIPVLDCVEPDTDAGRLIAYWGYVNSGANSRNVPIGTQNFFSPNPINRGQPAVFLPGRHSHVFATAQPFGTSLTWILVSNSAVAQDDPELHCAEPPISSAFSYHGYLERDGSPAQGSFDLRFTLFASEQGGEALGTVIATAVPVQRGLFQVELDFGRHVFRSRRGRHLEIAVTGPVEGAEPIVLSPRLALRRSLYSHSADSADRVHSIDLLDNTVAGSGAGSGEVSGRGNTFVGAQSGRRNTTGSHNTFLGAGATANSANLNHATAVGAGAVASASHEVVLGTGADNVRVPGSLAVLGGGTLTGDVDIAGNLSVSGILSGQLQSYVLNSQILRLRGAGDSNHGLIYSSLVDGPEFRGFGGFVWRNGIAGANERMRLHSNGNLSIGGSLSQGSDARLKRDVEPLTDALDQVLRLRAVRFHWRPELDRDTAPQIGFIAQEVEAVIPELVSTDEDGGKSVAYGNTAALLAEAIKQQHTQIEAQQRVIAGLLRLVCQDRQSDPICETTP